MFQVYKEGSHEKYRLLFKISAVFSYLFFVFGLSQLTLIVQNYWQFSSQIGNFVWIQNLLSLLFSGVMIWILVKTGHGYLFHIPKKKMALVFDFDSISGSAPDLF